MALKPCSECGHIVSTEALSCPECGYSPRASCVECVSFWEKGEDGNDTIPPCESSRSICPAFRRAFPSDRLSIHDTMEQMTEEELRRIGMFDEDDCEDDDLAKDDYT